MSDRGSYITDFIYCYDCFVAVQEVLRSVFTDEKRSPIVVMKAGIKDRMGVVAGRVNELYSGGELQVMMDEVFPELAERVCHRVRFAVLPEDASCVIYAVTKGDWGPV